MNKSRIDWPWKPLWTWNPVSGCLHSCRNTYCYNTTKKNSPMNRFGIRYHDGEKMVRTKKWRMREICGAHVAMKGEIYPFGYDPTFYPHRLEEPLKKKEPCNIFVVDVGDLMGKWVPAYWISTVIEIARRCPHHTLFFLTKNPARYGEFDFPENCWLGATITGEQNGKSWPCNLKNDVIGNLYGLPNKTFLSIEPLLGNFSGHLFTNIDQLIVGAQTGPGAVIPKKEWIESIKHPNVYYKENIKRYM